jgi:hypothetical protein
MWTTKTWSRLMDGERPWGSFEVQADRFGVTRYRLTVYPPGIDAVQRRHIRVWRAWPVWGAALWLLAEIVLTDTLDPWHALGVSIAVALGTGAAAWRLAAPMSAQVRTWAVAVLRSHDDPDSHVVARELSTFAEAMAVADTCLARGDISTVDHELMWWRVYRRLDPAQRPTRQGTK